MLWQNKNREMEQKNRILWIDILNVIACMGVLLLHSTNAELHHFGGEISFNWCLGLLTHSFFLWPVDVFFMLSGYTLIRRTILNSGGVKNFFERRLRRLLIPVMTWNVIYMAYSFVYVWKNGENFEDPLVILSKFISFEYNPNMWFFVPLICVYVSIPFVTIFVLNARRETLKLYLSISLALSVLAPIEADFSVRTSLQDIFLFGTRFLVYAIAGYYFGNYEISSRTRRKIYVCSFLCIGIMIVGTVVLSLNIPSHYKYFIQYTNVPCSVVAYSVFLYFRYTDWYTALDKIKIKPKHITLLSSLSLGIYLVQKLGFNLLGHISFLKDNMITTFLLMYVGCICCVWTLKQIPFIRKIV